MLPRSYNCYAMSMSVNSTHPVFPSLNYILLHLMRDSSYSVVKIYYIHEVSPERKKRHIHGFLCTKHVLDFKALNASYVGINIWLRRVTHYPPLSSVIQNGILNYIERSSPQPRPLIPNDQIHFLLYMMKSRPTRLKTMIRTFSRSLNTYAIANCSHQIIRIELIIPYVYKLFEKTCPADATAADAISVRPTISVTPLN